MQKQSTEKTSSILGRTGLLGEKEVIDYIESIQDYFIQQVHLL